MQMDVTLSVIMSEMVKVGSLKKSMKENMTPHKITLLVLVKEYCAVKDLGRSKQSLSFEDSQLFQATMKHERSFSIKLLKLLQSPDMILSDLIRELEAVFGPSKLMYNFQSKLTDLNDNGIAALMDFIQSLEGLLVDSKHPTPLVNKSSVLGLFLRRMMLAFDKLSFSLVVQLHNWFKMYYKLAFPSHTDEDASLSHDISMDELYKYPEVKDIDDDLEVLDKGGASQKQAEYFIAKQATLLQTNEAQALNPKELQTQIKKLLDGNPDLAETHYLSYLNNMRVNEFCGSVHSLYHYFDRNALNNQDNKNNSDDVCKSFRYAALNLAALHCRFGHREEAYTALLEAIKMAQESNDHVCLQHALIWLCRLEKESNVDILLERGITKTGELNLPYLTALGIQASTKQKGLSAASPSSVFEYLVRSEVLNCHHSMIDLMTSGYAQKAALWQMYGKSDMALLSYQLLLNLNTSDSTRMGLYHNGEAACMALCGIAIIFAHQGHYSCAFELINAAKVRFPKQCQYAHIWILTELQLTFERAMHHGKWHDAETSLSNMTAVNRKESELRKIELLLGKQDIPAAFQLANNLLEKCEKEKESAEYKTRVLLILSELLCQTNNPTTAILHLTECLSLANQHHLEYLLTLTTLTLANTQLHLGLADQAYCLVEQVLLTVLSHGNIYDKARALFLYTKCNIAISVYKTAEQRKDALLSAVIILNTVVENFRQVEAFSRAKDALYYQAVLYHELGYVQNRNSCALHFKQLQQQDMHSSLNSTTLL